MNLDAAKGGQKYPPIYEHPYWWAKRFGELEQFHASYTQSVACATAINLTLAKHYDFDTGHPNIAPAAKEIVDKFGLDRVRQSTFRHSTAAQARVSCLRFWRKTRRTNTLCPQKPARVF